MTNIVKNNQNISSGLTPPSSSFNTTTATKRVVSRGGGGGRGGNGSQACAACKYQRRRCAPDCMLAPYFPVERQKEFLNAHKLFGVSNILRVLKNVIPSQRDNAMKSLIFEANIRAADPVGGCYRIIMNLYRQINLYETELQFVYNEILRVQAVDIQQNRNNINTKACSAEGINNSMGSFEPTPLHERDRQHRNNINTKACSVQGINNSTVSFGQSSLHRGFNRSCIAESSNQMVKGQTIDDEFEIKVAMSSTKDKQTFVEHEDLKPYFGNFYDCKGKGLATELSNDKVVSKTRVN